MKTGIIAICYLLSAIFEIAFAQGTAFTYQGRLTDADGPASGSYDLTFTLFATNTSGVAIAGPVTNSAAAVSNGLFTTTIDFGSGVFAGASNWLEIAIRTNGTGSFTTLTPRQQVTPTPYAIFANTASNLSGTLPTAQLSGTLTLTQLPGAVVTDNETSLNLSGAFSGTYSGNGGGLTNLGGTFVWQTVSGTTQQAQPNTGYIITNNLLVTLTLPTAPNIGDVVRVSGIGFSGWIIAQNIGQSVLLGVLPGNIAGVNWTAQTGSGSRNWWSVASSADGTKLVAVVDLGQIYTSPDSGVTWTAHGITTNWYSVASSADGTKLAAVVNNGQIYTSTDSGTNWTAQTGSGSRNWWSIASSADGTKLVAVVDIGQIYTSPDSGVTWTARASSQFWDSVASSADGTKLVAVDAFGQIYTSPDSGVTWTPRAGSQNWQAVASWRMEPNSSPWLTPGKFTPPPIRARIGSRKRTRHPPTGMPSPRRRMEPNSSRW